MPRGVKQSAPHLTQFEAVLVEGVVRVELLVKKPEIVECNSQEFAYCFSFSFALREGMIFLNSAMGTCNAHAK